MSQQILGNSSREEFEYYKNLSFELKFDYGGSEDWRDYWNLDGKRANIQNGSDGMVFAAGPTAMDHACHAVDGVVTLRNQSPPHKRRGRGVSGHLGR